MHTWIFFFFLTRLALTENVLQFTVEERQPTHKYYTNRVECGFISCIERNIFQLSNARNVLELEYGTNLP